MTPLRSAAPDWGSKSIFLTAGWKTWGFHVLKLLTAGTYISRWRSIFSRNSLMPNGRSLSKNRPYLNCFPWLN